MNEPKIAMTILVAEDDPDHQLIIKEGFEETHLPHELVIVDDGEELMDYLYRKNKHVNAIKPDIILLDLNMPKKNGLEALKEIKADVGLQNIPIVVLTGSKDEEDLTRSYNLGINLYINKPTTYAELIKMLKWLDEYWNEIVHLPSLQD